MQVVIIGGAGTVGSTVAYTLAVERTDVDVRLVDVLDDASTGHSIDARHARTLGQLPQFTPDGAVGTVDAAPAEPESLTDADVVVVAASVPRPTGGAQRGGRIQFLERNRELATSIGELLATRDPLPVIVVTNPLDQITYRVWKATGWDRRYILGYSLSETARTADRISTIREVPANDVYCPTIGEHGENVVPLFSRLTVDGTPVTLSESERQDVRDYVRDVPYDVIDMRGPEESSRWVTGRGVARLAQAVLDDGFEGQPVALSVPLEGEYGCTDVCLSVPVEFGRNGVTRVFEWELDDRERDLFEAACESVKAKR